MQYSKTPQENKLQNQLYHSQYPQNIQKLKNDDESNMRLSLISLDNNRKSELDKSSCRGNKFSYQYKRVNNIFKLVSIQNNEGEEDEQLKKIQSLEKQMKNLMGRVEHLQGKQDNKKERIEIMVEALHQQIAWLAQRDKQSELKLQSKGQEMREIRERLEQIEQQFSVNWYQFQKLQQIQSQTVKLIKFDESIFEEKLKNQIQQKIAKLAQEYQHKVAHLENQIKELSQSEKTLLPHKKTVLKKRESVPLNEINILKKIESYELVESEKQYFVGERIYRLDQSGVLLDENGFRLVDQNNKEIMLDSEHLEILKKFAILDSVQQP